jgi:hypothetical protein
MEAFARQLFFMKPGPCRGMEDPKIAPSEMLTI